MRDTLRQCGPAVGILAAALLMLPVGGCGREAPKEGSVAARRGCIALVGAGPNDPLWPVLSASAERFARQGALLEIRTFNAPDDTPEAQARLLATLPVSRLRGICVHPVNPGAIESELGRQAAQGIMVVSMLAPVSERVRVAHVGLDDAAIGAGLAGGLLDALGPAGGSIMVLKAEEAGPAARARFRAFRDKLEDARQVNVFAELDCRADPLVARSIIRERGARYPRLSAWVAMDDWPCSDGTPAPEVFTGASRYITFGGLPRQWPAIRSGLCPVMVAAEYGEVAGKALQCCESAIRSPLREPRDYRVPVRLVTTANLADYVKDWNAWCERPK
jgi:ABC-type sugar transport system substrate-binding protein